MIRFYFQKFFVAIVKNEFLEPDLTIEPERLNSDLCNTSYGKCYSECHQHQNQTNRGVTKTCCCYCQKRCCVAHRYWICLSCYVPQWSGLNRLSKTNAIWDFFFFKILFVPEVLVTSESPEVYRIICRIIRYLKDKSQPLRGWC